MMEAALKGVARAADAAGVPSRSSVIAVTQLTSTSQTIMDDEIGIPGTVEDTVLR